MFLCYPCHRTLPQLLQFLFFMNLYFVYVINIRFICDGEIYLLTYLLNLISCLCLGVYFFLVFSDFFFHFRVTFFYFNNFRMVFPLFFYLQFQFCYHHLSWWFDMILTSIATICWFNTRIESFISFICRKFACFGILMFLI